MEDNQLPINGAQYYTENGFWRKVAAASKKAGGKLLETALSLFYAMQDSDTPKWAKTVILGTLGYFIMPVDAIPDFAPLVGFSDDMTALLSALAVVGMHVKKEHKEKAKEKIEKILGRN